MIKEAILAHPEESRSGIGRPTIKKFIQTKHPKTAAVPEAQFKNLVSKAITKGAEKNLFLLPKGPSGKVKLAPSVKATAAKKPAAPPVAKKAPVKKAAAPKKVCIQPDIPCTAY